MPPPVAPVVRGLKVVPSRFAAAPSGPVTTSGRTGRVGGRVSYSQSVAGKITFTVQRQRGRRFVTVGSFIRTSPKAGAVTFVFRGRLAKGKLAAGTYRLSGVLRTAAGKRSPTPCARASRFSGADRPRPEAARGSRR
jgi:hypothetical protein